MAHCGGPPSGSFIHSLVATDICTGWTEAVSLLAREQSLVVAGLEAAGKQLAFPLLGIDSDIDSAFINETLVQYCADRGIEFTRSRAYRSNDQAWIEQKDGSVVRRLVVHDRYSGQVAGQTMAHLYAAVRLYVKYFQPWFKLIDKTRHGSTTVKRYSQPASPCDRLIQHDATGAELKAVLEEYRAGLDPVFLLHTIREARSALVAATSPELRETPQGDSLDRFLAKLPSLWRQGETRPTHAARVRSPPPESAPDPDRGCGTAARPPRTGCPVHNRHQVEESPGRVQVDDVGRPHPVGPADFGVLQQIGEDPLIRRRRAGAGRR